MRGFCACGLLVAACGEDPRSAGPAVATDDAAATTAFATTSGPEGSTSTADPSGARPTGTFGTDTSTGGAEPDTGSRDSSGDAGSSSGGPLPTEPADCRTLLQAEPGTPDGVYSFHAGGFPDGAPFDAYCDMTTDGGGWTLVARTAPGTWTNLEFGWAHPTGSLEDERVPYSLGAAQAELDVSEILVGPRAEGHAWGPNAYKLPVPEHFLFVYGAAPVATVPETVLGECAPEGGPDRLRWVGWTDLDSSFWFAETEDDLADGLEPAAIDTDVATCEGGGLIHGLPGMLMVR